MTKILTPSGWKSLDEAKAKETPEQGAAARARKMAVHPDHGMHAFKPRGKPWNPARYEDGDDAYNACPKGGQVGVCDHTGKPQFICHKTYPR